MSVLPSIVTSSLGKKYAMGVTGLLLVLFVLGHMSGNLLIFFGAKTLNEYAEFLHEMGHGVLIWVARGGLLTVFLVHLVLAFLVKTENQKARPVDYATHAPQVSNWAARHMMLTGLVVLVFVVYHIAHLTLGLTDLSHDWRTPLEHGRPHYLDVFAMVVVAFRDPYIAVFYIVAQLVLATHLWHGASSWFQSVGMNRKSWRTCTSWVGPILALVIFAGNSSIPLAVQAGYGRSYLKEIDPNAKIPITMVNYTMGNVYPEEDADKPKPSGGSATSPPATPLRLDGSWEGKDNPKGGDQSKGRPKMGMGGFKGKEGGTAKKGLDKSPPPGESPTKDGKSESSPKSK